MIHQLNVFFVLLVLMLLLFRNFSHALLSIYISTNAFNSRAAGLWKVDPSQLQNELKAYRKTEEGMNTLLNHYLHFCGVSLKVSLTNSILKIMLHIFTSRRFTKRNKKWTYRCKLKCWWSWRTVLWMASSSSSNSITSQTMSREHLPSHRVSRPNTAS